MNRDLHLKLQACLDGELPEAEARELGEVLGRDAEANALLAELRNTRSALAGFEAEVKLPESREFYWSKIKREIQRLEKPEPARPAISLWTAWRKSLVPLGVAVVFVLGVVLLGLQSGFWSRARAPQLQTAMADSGAFTYRDDSTGVTLVWLSYSGENEFAESGPVDTLQ